MGIKPLFNKIGTKILFNRIPILGALNMSKFSNHKDAAVELLCTLFMSLAPVILWFVVWIMSQDGGTKPLFVYFAKQIMQNGELIIYSATLLAPTLYMVNRNRDKDKENQNLFPSRISFNYLLIMFTALASVIFVIQRLDLQMWRHNIICCSIFIFGFAVLVFYFALVYNNVLPPSYGDTRRDKEVDFFQKLQEHRKDTGGIRDGK